jgi:hypothetical protein
MRFSEAGTPDVENLYARLGTGGRNFCFAGHTDVVPVGNAKAWTVDPFGAEEIDGVLYGRGASDMKGAVAAFAAAASRFLARRGAEFGGSISLLITGDEEGPSINGTKKVLGCLGRDCPGQPDQERAGERPRGSTVHRAASSTRSISRTSAPGSTVIDRSTVRNPGRAIRTRCWPAGIVTAAFGVGPISFSST